MSDQEQTQLKDMWKVFGMETEIGKKFHQMYNTNKREVKVTYPKVTKKKREEKEVKEERDEKENKVNKIQIEYPVLRKQKRQKYHKIDYVPRRKQHHMIEKEMEEIREDMKKVRLRDGQDR